ncbi:hypothetical protein A6R68_13034 [Neotoma lepida]|uniref:Uncharacterized protein n=1 Tax=Neotoma lepida TaxID=56216 RepID=A0A1A6H469_NEOLE|nr:hypothetical protein A6R68_13034 [Neotoma lepida]
MDPSQGYEYKYHEYCDQEDCSYSDGGSDDILLQEAQQVISLPAVLASFDMSSRLLVNTCSMMSSEEKQAMDVDASLPLKTILQHFSGSSNKWYGFQLFDKSNPAMTSSHGRRAAYLGNARLSFRAASIG